jgi:hypothetical protein
LEEIVLSAVSTIVEDFWIGAIVVPISGCSNLLSKVTAKAGLYQILVQIN